MVDYHENHSNGAKSIDVRAILEMSKAADPCLA